MRFVGKGKMALKTYDSICKIMFKIKTNMYILVFNVCNQTFYVHCKTTVSKHYIKYLIQNYVGCL